MAVAAPHFGRGGGPLSAKNPGDELFLSERRGGSRKSLIGGRLVTVRLGADGNGIGLDLSEDGIGLRAFPDLKVGTTTDLFFELPDLSTSVEVQATVAWVERT